MDPEYLCSLCMNEGVINLSWPISQCYHNGPSMNADQPSKGSVSNSTPKVTIQNDEITTASRDTVSEVEKEPININHNTTPTEVAASKQSSHPAHIPIFLLHDFLSIMQK